MTKLLIAFLACAVGITYATAEDIRENDDSNDRKEIIEEELDDRREIIDGCLRPGAIATGKHIRTGSLRVNSAKKCQALCAAHEDCNYFRWRGRDLKAKWRLRRRCYLMEEMGDVKKRSQWTWGPKEC